jgi:hypothetical protein
MSDDQQNRGGIFVTNEKGLVPPLVTTDFIVDDKGNASKYHHSVTVILLSNERTVNSTSDYTKLQTSPVDSHPY